MPFLNYLFGSSIILSNFLGFAHFLGNLFISIKITMNFSFTQTSYVLPTLSMYIGSMLIMYLVAFNLHLIPN